MGVEVFKVIYGQQDAGMGLSGLRKEYTKTEAEALDPSLTEKVIVKGPVESVKVITVEAENKEMAAEAVRLTVSNYGGQQGENFICVKNANYETQSPQ